jgi:uncharacterized protein DUF5317
VTIILAGLALGVAIGYAIGGRLGRLARNLKLRAIWLIYVALGMQVLVRVPPVSSAHEATRLLVVLLSYGVIAVWLGLNAVSQRRALRVAVALITVGWLANLAPIALNAGMPVSGRALARAGNTSPTAGSKGFFKHVIASDRTDLNWLGDIIPMRRFSTVISIGDIILLAGIALVIAAGMRLRQPSYDVAERARLALERSEHQDTAT